MYSPPHFAVVSASQKVANKLVDALSSIGEVEQRVLPLLPFLLSVLSPFFLPLSLPLTTGAGILLLCSVTPFLPTNTFHCTVVSVLWCAWCGVGGVLLFPCSSSVFFVCMCVSLSVGTFCHCLRGLWPGLPRRAASPLLSYLRVSSAS